MAKQKMQQARVCLAPLRFGAGIKGKLAEAMFCGTPNVTTNIGIEGMAMGSDWSGLTTDLDPYPPVEPKDKYEAPQARQWASETRDVQTECLLTTSDVD